jgi:ABC-type oligopeptide transport system substrate-binding subunit
VADFTIGTTTWIDDYADPLTFLELWTSNSNLNKVRFDNEKFDKLIEDPCAEDDTNKFFITISIIFSGKKTGMKK